MFNNIASIFQKTLFDIRNFVSMFWSNGDWAFICNVSPPPC